MVFEPFAIIHAVRTATKDPTTPVKLEIMRRHPRFKRDQRLAIAGLIIILVILLVCMVMGWELAM